ncbi:MAG: hypothetical protein AAB871_01950 [Patescibacteria group bacterium]
MKKLHWIIVIILLVLASLFAIFYKSVFKHYSLPEGSPAERPLN